MHTAECLPERRGLILTTTNSQLDHPLYMKTATVQSLPSEALCLIFLRLHDIDPPQPTYRSASGFVPPPSCSAEDHVFIWLLEVCFTREIPQRSLLENGTTRCTAFKRGCTTCAVLPLRFETACGILEQLKKVLHVLSAHRHRIRSLIVEFDHLVNTTLSFANNDSAVCNVVCESMSQPLECLEELRLVLSLGRIEFGAAALLEGYAPRLYALQLSLSHLLWTSLP